MKATHSHRIATPSQRITYQLFNEAGELLGTQTVVLDNVKENHGTGTVIPTWVRGTRYDHIDGVDMETIYLFDPATITKREQQYQDLRYGTVSYRVVS